MLARDDEKEDSVVDTNEYIIVSDGEGFIMEPGGTEIFPQVVSAVSSILPIEDIKHIFTTHQDPDVISFLPLWMGLGSGKCLSPTLEMNTQINF
jgi:flavorubredoxin